MPCEPQRITQVERVRHLPLCTWASYKVYIKHQTLTLLLRCRYLARISNSNVEHEEFFGRVRPLDEFQATDQVAFVLVYEWVYKVHETLNPSQ